MSAHPLGRRTPPDFEHVEKYPLRALLDDPAHRLAVPPPGERSLGLPWWWKQHDQHPRNSCVGHGESAERSITNRRQRLLASGQDVTYRYDANWLYDEALRIDEWPGEADAGTSLRAGYEVLVMRGHRRVQRGVTGPEVREHGVVTYRWATTVDEMRAAIAAGLAVATGVNWYTKFFTPELVDGEYWIGRGSWGSVAGGHCTCKFRYSDRRQAFRVMGSWGEDSPPSWLPYASMERLLGEYGEAAVVTDR